MFVIGVAGLLVAALIPLGKSKIQHLDKYTAKFARNLHDYHITVPSLLSNQDRFVSNSDDKTQLDLSFISEKVLHLEVPAFGRKLHLLLSKSTKFLGPGLVIEREDNVRQHNIDCHYAGQIKDQPNSLVSISNCQGLKGLIQTEDGERYFIEPAHSHNTSNADGQNAHILYKRSISDPLLPWKQENQLCADQETLTLNRRLRSPYLEMRSKRHSRRGRRSVSTERNVEILMVADKTMYEFYKDGLEQYLLTIANMVSSIYRDPSIGTAVNIVLVRVVILKENPSSLKVTHHAGNTLKSFCRWASLINPKSERHPNHHDVAVFITRHDICRGINEPCETLGLSQVNGLCTKDKSCNINEDSGLTLAYTIAHEIGHNLGMLHDGNENACKWNYDKPFLMSPLLQASGRQQLWSPCSRNYLRRFLNKGWGWCLNDEPSKHDFQFPTMLPGVIYDADHQCRLQYGATSSHCAGMTDICNRLWCRSGKACHSKLEPAADGTKCGDNKWCYKGGCVERGKIPASVDGGWGSWWNYSECSRTCGGGVSYSERHCDSPRPAHGGKYCIGEWKKYKLCNTQSCPAGSVGYRDLQCSQFDGKLLRNRRWQWKPRYSRVSPCELHCTPKGLFGLYFSKKFSDQVLDGTPCFPGKRDVCINGKCENVGCDNVLHSNAKEDKCGVCRGDGTSCKTVKSTFDQKTGIGYVETKVIPRGARNIRVEEVAGAPNYLALRSKRGKWYLNGDWYIQQSGEYPAGGTTVFYTRKHNKETFEAVGPTTDDLHIMLLFQTRNPGINFEYTIPKNQTVTQKLVFNWRSRDWTPCSATCGVGTTRSEVECVEESGTPVDDKYCKSTVRPDDRQKTCNEDPCPPTWWHGPWQPCSKTCGNGISIRSVLCVRSNGKDEQMALKDEHCVIKEKPLLVRSCFKAACPLQWTVGSWSKCTMSCGRGVKKRKVTCEARNTNEKCDSKAVPISWAYCGLSSCPPAPTMNFQSSVGTVSLLSTFKLRDTNKVNSTREDVNIPKYKIEKHCTGKKCRSWNVGNWSKCSTTCDRGIQVRRIYCAGSQRLCDRRTKPSKIRVCIMRPCAQWRTGPWTKCSATCGDGMRKRIITCSNIKTRLTSKDCDMAKKPDHYENCHVKKCPEQSKAESLIQQKPTQESFSSCVEKGRDIYFCKLVVLHKFCQFELWRERCCQTCTQTTS